MTAPLNQYADLATFKAWLGLRDGANDDLLQLALNAASRAVDSYCQRKFWLDPSPVARTFQPKTLTYLDLSARDGGDIGSLDGFVLTTDPSGSGSFDVTWASTDYELQPNNALVTYPEPSPYTAIGAVGTRTFPWLVNTWLTRFDRVKVTARWGWPEVPQAVRQATLIKAARIYHRKDSPQGVAGFGEFGAVRITQKMDPDVADLLSGYRVWAALIA